MSPPTLSGTARRSHGAEAANRPSFWAKVNMLGDCWVWIGGTTPAGYGKVGYGGRILAAHRCAFEFTFGRLSEGRFVCHRCDNPPCVNPAHLYAGTPKENTADMHRRGRAGLGRAVGSANRNAVLTEELVVDLRERFARGATPKALAELFGVSPSGINQIIRGKTWRHAGGPICTIDRRGLHRKKAA